MFAVRNHGLQDYDGFPYHKHLQDVERVVLEYTTDINLRVAAWLHDVLEDGPCNYGDLKKSFGETIAEIVYKVTDELGRNRKERKEKTLPKTRKCPNATFIKICDRIANTENSNKRGHKMAKAYDEEYVFFRRSLKVENEHNALWLRLDTLMNYTNS
jgi:guanosine-3',5'-bis(diphosphate) 3'-pyrophosphohydrolase